MSVMSRQSPRLYRVRKPKNYMLKLQMGYGVNQKNVIIYNRDRSVYGEVPMTKLPFNIQSYLYNHSKLYMMGRLDYDGSLVLEPKRGYFNERW